MIELETLKIDVVNNEKKHDILVFKRNELNVEIIRMEGVIAYIKELINVIELKKLESEKEAKKEVKK